MNTGISAVAAVAILAMTGLQDRLGAHGSAGQRARPPAAAPSPRSVWDGVYTVPQALRGAALSERCTPCHGADLEGNRAPMLIGPAFLERWNGKALDDLFVLTQINVAATDRGNAPNTGESVSQRESADFLAYLLLQNRFPAGPTELPTDLKALGQIHFQPSRPEIRP